MNEKLLKVDKLLTEQYGIGVSDCDEETIVKWLRDGDEPQAIVDDIAEKRNLPKRPTWAKSRIDELVCTYREIMEKHLGRNYADAVSDDAIRSWLMNGHVGGDEEEEVNRLAEWVEDGL